MKKVYSQGKQPPNCPRCDDVAAWKHDAKGRWWCRTCGRAFTPGITAAGSGIKKASVPKPAVVPDATPPMRTRVRESRPRAARGNPDYYEEGDVEYEYYTTNGDSEEDGGDASLDPNSPSRIRKLTSRRSSTERYKNMLNDSGEVEEEGAEEEGSRKRKKSEDWSTEGKVKGERPKKTPTLCPHTDKPYYAKGKCRPCYWAEWRREGGKKGKESPSVKKQKLNNSETEDPVIQKRAVKIEDAQCMAFKLNKSTDYQIIYDLLVELRSYFITDEILRGSLLLIVVKKLTQSPCNAIAEVAKILFDEFAEILSGRTDTTQFPPLPTTSNGPEGGNQGPNDDSFGDGNNNNTNQFTPISSTSSFNFSQAYPYSNIPISTHSFATPYAPQTMAAPFAGGFKAPAQFPDQMTLVNEIAMMHNAIAQLSQMNNAMLNNLTTYQASKLMENLPPSLQGVVFPPSPASTSSTSTPTTSTTPSTPNFDTSQPYPVMDPSFALPYYAPTQGAYLAVTNTTTTTTSNPQDLVDEVLSYGALAASTPPTVPGCPTPDGGQQVPSDGTVPQTTRFPPTQTDRIIKEGNEDGATGDKQTMGFSDFIDGDNFASLIFA